MKYVPDPVRPSQCQSRVSLADPCPSAYANSGQVRGCQISPSEIGVTTEAQPSVPLWLPTSEYELDQELAGESGVPQIGLLVTVIQGRYTALRVARLTEQRFVVIARSEIDVG